MGGTHRSAQRALLVVLGVAAALLPPPGAGVRAQPYYLPQSPEPPLVGAPPVVPAAIAHPLEPADPPTPSVSLHVRAPSTAAPGQEVDYRILVENTSRAAAHHVIVRAPAPANAVFVRASPEPSARDPQVLWELGTLQPGTSKEILLTLKPSGAGEVEVCARVQFEHGQCVRTHIGAEAPPAPPPIPAAPVPPAPAPMPPVPTVAAPAPKAALRLRKTGPAQAIKYDIVTFQLEVANTGSADAVNVEVTDSLPPGLRFQPRKDTDPSGNVLTWKLGTLAPGQTRRVSYEANAVEAGDQENKAQVTAAGDLREFASWRMRVNEPKLAVSLTGPSKGLLGKPETYRITVANLGVTVLANVQVVDEWPAGVNYVNSSDAGRMVGGHVQWVLGDLAPGGRKAVEIILSADNAAEVVNRATAKAERGVTAKAETKTLFEGAAGLRLEMNKSLDPLPVGKEADYTFRVVNGGTAPARSVQLTVTAPEQLQFVSKEGPVEAAQVGQTLTFAPLAALEAGKEAIYKVHVRALRAAEVKLVVELKSDELTTPLHEEETTTIFGEPPVPAPPDSP